MEPSGGEADWLRRFGATTAKLGLAGERVLVYGKAGVSYGRASGYNGPLDNEVTRTHVGWAAGAGAEYAVTERITAFAEYN
jgi:outer membrane immunogenic protein